jgi:undecaprenyl phosphate N,N'-diacetylbacillosamine 1-phosphate transferase
MKIARRVKRMLDVMIAMLALLVLSPLLIAIAIWIKLDSPGSVLFRQERAGLHGRPFRICKFRSMVRNAEQIAGGPVTRLDSPVVTRSGRFLRLTSLDELPQLINVLMGDMSLVGPRPLLLFTIQPDEMRRLNVRPGITGMSQVGGRQRLTWGQRMALDLWYVDHWNLWLDVCILVKTIPVVVSRQNVYDADGEMKARE